MSGPLSYLPTPLPGPAGRRRTVARGLRALGVVGALAGCLLPGCGGGGDGPDGGDSGPPGSGDGGAADAMVAPGSDCEHPLLVLPGDTYEGDTGGFSDDRTASCSAGSNEAPDVFYRMDLGDTPRDLVIDGVVDEAAEAPFDLILSARSDCTDIDTELGCADTGLGEHLELLAVAGEVTVIVDGTAQYGHRSSGAYTLVTRTRELVGTGQPCDPDRVIDRCETGLRCVAATCTPDSPELACAEAADLTGELDDDAFHVVGRTLPFAADHYQMSCAFNPQVGSGEDIFRFTIDRTVSFTATTDFPETRYDTVLGLRSGGCDGAEVACHDDVDLDAGNVKSTLVVEELPPGTYYLMVDGSSYPGTGQYRLAITLDP